MADKVAPYYDEEKVVVAYQIFCPGCGRTHVMHFRPYGKPGAQWVFNGSLDFPTFTPSINNRSGPYPPGDEREGEFDVCHSFVENGLIRFLGDCTHALANKVVELPDFPDKLKPKLE